MGIKKHFYRGSNNDREHLRGNYWGASGDGMEGRITMARGRVFEECSSINDCDSGDGRINNGIREH